MINLAEFHFLRPYWFLALIPLVYLLWHRSQKALSQTGWKGIIDEALLPYVLTDEVDGHNSHSGKTSLSKNSRSKIVLLIAGILAIVALAGPVFERLPQPVFRSDTSLVIALDLSHSMDAEDLKPSRLARARYKIADLLKQRKDGQTALLVYAGEAFVVTPLTDDTGTILSQIKALTTDLMPAQGNRTDKALKKASELLTQAGAKQGDVLLITDGISNSPSDKNWERVLEAATNLNSRGYRLLALGVGTREGAPIKLPNGDYLTDTAGNIVIPSLQENELKRLTGSVNGIYQRYSSNDDDINRLTLLLDVNPADTEALETDLSVERWREDGPWLLLLLLPLAALAFRKGALLIVVLSFSSVMTIGDVEAGDLWRSSDQLGADLLEKGDPEKAATEFEDPRWKGSAQYQAGDYEGALKSWTDLDQSQSGSHTNTNTDKQVQDLYNMGNAQVKVGDYPAALESYKKALQKAPDFEDAQYNYDLVKEALEKQQQEQENQEKGEQEGGEEKESDNSSNKDSQQQEGDEGQEKDQSDDPSGSEGADSQEQQSGDSKESGQQTESGGDPQDHQDSQSQKKDKQASEAKQQGMKEGQDDESEESHEGEDDNNVESHQAESLSDETQQALEQWLRRIPDDPGGLLRRKFIHQYKYQYQADQESGNKSDNTQGEEGW